MISPIVKILVSIPDERSFDACTLVFDTLRVGFPTAKIHVDINGMTSNLHARAVEEKAERAECFSRRLMTLRPIHHAEWIKNAVDGHIFDCPLIILDADTIFWKSVEDWEVPDDKMLLAGYYVPKMWNDFAKCVSLPRIHTSFMFFTNAAKLRQAIKLAYPYSHERAGEYCPCDPFMPAVRFIEGRPYFWDSCANLFEMLKPGQVRHFGPAKLECYDHLNSASFYDVMMERMDDNSGFKLAHTELVKTPEKLRNLWPIVNSYYRQKEIEGSIVMTDL